MSVFKDSKKDIYLFVLLGLKRSLKKTLNTTLMKKKGGGDKVETENEKRSDHTWGNFIPYKSHTPFTLYNKKETKWVYIHKMHGNILL